MDFALSEDQQFFQESIRKYLNSLDQTAIARSYIDEELMLTKKVWAGLSELGYLGINVAEKYNGIGEETLSMVPVFEEIGRSLLPGPYAETLGLVVPLLQKYGTDEQKQQYLPDIVSGKRIFSLAFLESGISFDADEVQLTPQKEENDYILNGVKTLVPYVELANSLLVAVRTSSDEVDGLTLLIIDIEECPLEIKRLENFDEARSLSEITFDNISVRNTQRLGSEDRGWQMLKEGFDHFNVTICAVMVGGMEKVVEMATEYSNTREQFDRKIGSFQAIKHKIVDMKRELENARSLTYYAAWAIDKEAEDKTLAISSARSYATESFIRGAGHNIHIHGGIGVTTELDSHLYLKRARAYENYVGTVSDYLAEIGRALNA